MDKFPLASHLDASVVGKMQQSGFVFRSGLWRHRDFLKLWLGQTVSEIGSRVTREGLPLTAAMYLAASPLDMGLLSGGPTLTVFLLGLFAGAWADRISRRRLMIAADVGRALVLGA